jgi:hypothetical protein
MVVREPKRKAAALVTEVTVMDIPPIFRAFRKRSGISKPGCISFTSSTLLTNTNMSSTPMPIRMNGRICEQMAVLMCTNWQDVNACYMFLEHIIK